MPRSTNARAFAVCALALSAPLLQAACDSKTTGTAPSASVASSAPPAVSAIPSERPDGDEVKPVYPIDNLPPLPLAQRYCDVVLAAPKKRHDDCCPAIPVYVPIGECVRTLSSALRSGAVTIADADLDACAAAVTKETAGCDWIASMAWPTSTACLGIIKGTVKEGALCRSNIECLEGGRCRALGATQPGKCEPPLPAGRMCNVSTDSLAAFAGQDDFDRHHPECSGICVARRCKDTAAIGGVCGTSYECGSGATCVAGKCSATAPSAGQACTDSCASGARCIKAKCVATKAEGESCEEDGECRAHCERGDGGKQGQCAKLCPSFPRAKPQDKK